jgi:hypothetical protein
LIAPQASYSEGSKRAGDSEPVYLLRAIVINRQAVISRRRGFPDLTAQGIPSQCRGPDTPYDL